MNKVYAKENIRYSHLSKPLQRSHLKPFKTLTCGGGQGGGNPGE